MFKGILMAMGLVASALAHASVPAQALEQGGLKVEFFNGDALSPFVSKNGYMYVEIEPQRAKLQLTNTTDERLQIVFVFNSINPMTGRKAIMGDNGFVLKPHQSLTITQGRLSKKKKDSPVNLFQTNPDGSLHLLVFKERTDYPLVLPEMTAPPYGEENFVRLPNGQQRWVPPPQYPFRRLSDTPSGKLFITYGVSP